MLNHQMAASGLTLAMALLAGCAAQKAPGDMVAAAEPISHEYRTGSLIVQKEKHVTTDAERQGAQEAAALMQRGPLIGDPSKNK